MPATKHKPAKSVKPRTKAKRPARKPQPKVSVSSNVARKPPSLNVPISGPTAAGVSFASGAMPQSYIDVLACPHDPTFVRKDHNAKRVRFCVPFCRYGNGGTTTGGAPGNLPGSGALTVGGATSGAFQQAMVLGQPGAFIGDPTYPTSGGYLATYAGLSRQLMYETDTYTRFRYNRIRFTAIPSTATTASARSYWLAFSDDPAVSTVASTGTSTPALTLTGIINLPNVRLFPAWCSGVIDAACDRQWKYNQQYVANGTAVTNAFYLTPTLRQMSPGALVMACDYSNASGAPLLDGIIWMEGEVDVVDPYYDFTTPGTSEQKQLPDGSIHSGPTVHPVMRMELRPHLDRALSARVTPDARPEAAEHLAHARTQEPQHSSPCDTCPHLHATPVDIEDLGDEDFVSARRL